MRTIYKIILTIWIVALVIIMAGELSNPSLWWVQALAAAILFIILKLILGGKDGRNTL